MFITRRPAPTMPATCTLPPVDVPHVLLSATAPALLPTPENLLGLAKMLEQMTQEHLQMNPDYTEPAGKYAVLAAAAQLRIAVGQML